MREAFVNGIFTNKNLFFFFTKSPPVVQKMHQNAMTKTGKNKAFGEFMGKKPQISL